MMSGMLAISYLQGVTIVDRCAIDVPKSDENMCRCSGAVNLASCVLENNVTCVVCSGRETSTQTVGGKSSSGMTNGKTTDRRTIGDNAAHGGTTFYGPTGGGTISKGTTGKEAGRWLTSDTDSRPALSAIWPIQRQTAVEQSRTRHLVRDHQRRNDWWGDNR